MRIGVDILGRIYVVTRSALACPSLVVCKVFCQSFHPYIFQKAAAYTPIHPYSTFAKYSIRQVGYLRHSKIAGLKFCGQLREVQIVPDSADYNL
jgi:hypothetical protein